MCAQTIMHPRKGPPIPSMAVFRAETVANAFYSLPLL